MFGHVQTRVLLWLDTFSQEAATSGNSPKGLMGMGAGRMVGMVGGPTSLL